MTHPNNSQTSEATSSTETPGYKRLKFAVVFMGVLIVLGLAIIVTTIIYRAMGLGNSEVEKSKAEIVYNVGGDFKDLTIYAPVEGTLKSVNGSGEVLYLHFITPKGDVVKVLNLITGDIQGEVLVLPSK